MKGHHVCVLLNFERIELECTKFVVLSEWMVGYGVV